MVPLTVAVGSGLTVTLTELLWLHPAPLVTVTLSMALPVLPAVQVTLEVFCPAVMVPLVIDQA